MMELDLSINGEQIRHIGVVNTGETKTHTVRSGEEFDVHRYDVTAVNCESGETREFDVWHERDRGAVVLAETVLHRLHGEDDSDAADKTPP